MSKKPVRPKVIGVPYEEGTFWRRGAKDGPQAILEKLKTLRSHSIESGKQLRGAVSDWIAPEAPVFRYDSARSLDSIEDCAHAAIGEGCCPLFVGGDHAITLPIIRGLTKVYGRDGFGIIHLDAHSDTFEPIDGYAYHHGAPFRNIVNEGLVRAGDIYQFGIRGLARSEGLTFCEQTGMHSVRMREFRAKGCALRPFHIPKTKPYYVSIDIDVVDPAFAPGTGTPVPGGLTSEELLNIIYELSEYPLIGADLVEVAPVYDVSEITVLLAAHVMMEMLIHGDFTNPLVSEDSSR